MYLFFNFIMYLFIITNLELINSLVNDAILIVYRTVKLFFFGIIETSYCIIMGRKKTPKKIDDKSKLDVFATPVTRRNLNATYVKSASRPTFPNNVTSRKNPVIFKNSKKLIGKSFH